VAPKILAQTGVSLADVYDIEGSIVGVDHLDANDVNLVHEMGATIFSERLGATIQRFVTGDLAADDTFDLTLVVSGIYRVLSVTVLVDTAARINRAQLSLRDPGTGREIPFFIWTTGIDVEHAIRIVEEGAAVGNFTAMTQAVPQTMPTLGMGVGQRVNQRVGAEIVFRGLATSFGAGTVEATALVHVANASVERLGSTGLPIPSW